MTNLTIKLSTIQDVKKFVEIATQCPYDVDILSGRYVIDGKSLMGIFSLDLTQSIKVQTECSDPKMIEELKKFA